RISLRMAEASTWSHLPDGAACVPNRVRGHLCYQCRKASLLELRQILQHSRRRFDAASVDDWFEPWPWWRRPCLTAGGQNAIEAIRETYPRLDRARLSPPTQHSGGCLSVRHKLVWQ